MVSINNVCDSFNEVLEFCNTHSKNTKVIVTDKCFKEIKRILSVTCYLVSMKDKGQLIVVNNKNENKQ